MTREPIGTIVVGTTLGQIQYYALGIIGDKMPRRLHLEQRDTRVGKEPKTTNKVQKAYAADYKLKG